MKIIDFHNHIFDDRIAEKAIAALSKKCNLPPAHNGTKEALLRNMEKFGISKSVILPIATKPSQTEIINEWALSNCDEKLTIFGTFHPDNEDPLKEIDKISEMGLKGVKLHPDYQDFFADEDRMLPLYEHILNKGLILVFHCGIDIGLPPPVHCPPKRLRRVVDAMKGGKIVASHLGGFRMWDDVENYLVGQDIYLDTSMGSLYYPKEQFLRIVRNHSEDRILFATDSPWSGPQTEIENLKSSGLSDKALEKIFSTNAENLLK